MCVIPQNTHHIKKTINAESAQRIHSLKHMVQAEDVNISMKHWCLKHPPQPIYWPTFQQLSMYHHISKFSCNLIFDRWNKTMWFVSDQLKFFPCASLVWATMVISSIIKKYYRYFTCYCYSNCCFVLVVIQKKMISSSLILVTF